MTEASRTQWPLASAKGRWIVAATALGSGMAFLDGSVVNVALPRIQSDLHVPLSSLQWIIDAYALFLAALLLVGGALGDIFGRARIFVVGLVVFTAASIFCGLAPNANALIAARAVQGIGGALLVPGSLAIIKASISPEDSGRAIGLWAGLSGATAALGPLVGGYFVGSIGWRLIFFINVPLALITLYATIRHVPDTKEQRESRQLDWMGAVLTVLGLGGLTFGLIQGPESGWTNPIVPISLVVGAICLILFVPVELRSNRAMVPPNLFRSRNFTGSNLATVGVYFSFTGAFLFIVLKLQQVQGYSPLESGAALLPITALLLVLSPRTGGLLPRFGPRVMMTTGAGVITIGFGLFAAMGERPSYWTELFPIIVLFAVGMVIFITPLTATVMGSVPAEAVGTASGVNNAVARVASLLAVAILGVVVVAQFKSSLSNALPANLSADNRAALVSGSTRLADDPIPRGLTSSLKKTIRRDIDTAYLASFRDAMETCCALCLLSTIVCFTMVRTDP